MTAASTTEPGTPPMPSEPAVGSIPGRETTSSGRSPASAEWNAATWAGLAAFVAVWAWKFSSTWAAWGNLTIDSGHEMYVPWMLARGKMLYRDVWFLYGPGGPYFTSWLFRLFGARLNVLYWAGSVSALGSAIFLYLVGIRLSARLAGWTAGTVILLEAFQPSLFCFPLPYSYSTVYGGLVGCAFLWFAVSACSRDSWWWTFGAGTAAAAALIFKPEFGTACYGTLALLIAGQSLLQKSWKPLGRGVATSLPGALLCAGVLWWMISIGGVEFITQENIMSWPGSYFMKTFGKLWLAATGFSFSLTALHDCLFRTIPLVGMVALVYAQFWWERKDRVALLLKAALGLLIPASLLMTHYYSWESLGRSLEEALAAVFFPQDMVVYVSLAAAVAWWIFLARRGDRRILPLALVLSYAALLAFRILMGMFPEKYAIYYNGPPVLAFLLLVFLLVPPAMRGRASGLTAKMLVCAGSLMAVFLLVRREEVFGKYYVPLYTDRGMIRTTKMRAEYYPAAIRLMKEKAAVGEAVLSIPEDTGLYFFSGTECPTRVFVFDPGVHAPGKMVEEAIREIEAKNVRYLIWSNRTFPEYRAMLFGKDFDVPLGDYLRARFRPIGRLTNAPPSVWDWSATVWERIPQEQSK